MLSQYHFARNLDFFFGHTDLRQAILLEFFVPTVHTLSNTFRFLIAPCLTPGPKRHHAAPDVVAACATLGLTRLRAATLAPIHI